MSYTIYRKGNNPNHSTIETGHILIREKMVTQQQTLDRKLKGFVDDDRKRFSSP